MVSHLDATRAGTTAEPASALLRRLILACDPSTVRDVCLLVDARDALADLVEAVEATHSHIDYEPECGECVTLAALRERLGAKP